jgi:hypothetical protein
MSLSEVTQRVDWPGLVRQHYNSSGAATAGNAKSAAPELSSQQVSDDDLNSILMRRLP